MARSDAVSLSGLVRRFCRRDPRFLLDAAAARLARGTLTCARASLALSVGGAASGSSEGAFASSCLRCSWMGSKASGACDHLTDRAPRAI